MNSWKKDFFQLSENYKIKVNCAGKIKLWNRNLHLPREAHLKVS